MDQWPADSYSSWSPRRENPFAGQAPSYSDYSPYYGYASPISSRRSYIPESDKTRGRSSYNPFGYPHQMEIPVDRVRRNDRDEAEQDHRPVCGGCSECRPGNQNRRPMDKTNRPSVHGNTGYRQKRSESSESSSEESSPEEIESRCSQPLRILQTQPSKKSRSVDPFRSNPSKKSTSVNPLGSNLGGNNRRPVGVASQSSATRQLASSSVTDECANNQQQLAVDKDDSPEAAIDIKKSAEVEDAEEMSMDASIPQQLPTLNTKQQSPEQNFKEQLPTLNIPNKKSPIDILSDIELETAALDARIKAFAGTTKDREYVIIDELITKALLRLDAVESGGDLNIRNARKALVVRVQRLLTQLERKVGIARMEEVQLDEGALDGNQMENCPNEGESCETDSNMDSQDSLLADITNNCSDEPNAHTI